MRNNDKKIKTKSTKGRKQTKENNKVGTLYGIGIGPGDPQLLTLKAAAVLKKVDTIFAPQAKIKSDSLAADIIRPVIKKKKIVTMVFPMSKNKKILTKFWQDAAERIYKDLKKGKDVAFITLGDPFIFSTYIYLIRSLEQIDENIPIETIPGISSINAAAALGGIPLAESQEKFAVIPLPKKIEELRPYFKLFDTIVLLKIGKSLGPLIDFLKKEGLAETAFFARKVSSKDQFFKKGVADFTDKISGYLSVMVIRTKKKRNKK